MLIFKCLHLQGTNKVQESVDLTLNKKLIVIA
jgi:hypothetical protein